MIAYLFTLLSLVVPRLVDLPDSALRMSATEITNVQYEAFDPAHERTFSLGDDDAVVMVSWHEARAYCVWLSKQTGRRFRLPTEAEWELACRAGSTTAYHTGDQFPEAQWKAQRNNRYKEPVSLTVAQFAPNAWGLYDMHGNVEEWCLDPWDETGAFRVTRGGSHNMELRYLRSDSRSAAMPDDRSVLRGFRIVEDVAVRIAEPVFMTPQPYVLPPADSLTPFYAHNHQPAVAALAGGDLLAIWFSCEAEAGREMVVLQSRFHQGVWSPARLFFKVPERNMTGSALLRLDDGTLLHFNGVGDAGEWRDLALVLRRSLDDGLSWSLPQMVGATHGPRHQVIAGPIVTGDGCILLCCDAGPGGEDGTALHVSADGGLTWEDTGSTLAGIHAGIVELKDGTLMALGRGNAIDGRMPCSRSTDGGHSWSFSASPFPPIGSGQRLILKRLAEGPLLLCSFGPNGLFAALSYDEGQSWPVRKLLTDSSLLTGSKKSADDNMATDGTLHTGGNVQKDGSSRTFDGGAWTGSFTMDATHAEPRGYLAVTQTPDGLIHLLSSRLHYRFNLQWIEQ